jgi:hypothetical protein
MDFREVFLEVWTVFSDFYDHSNEYLGSIEPEFLNQLSNYQIFRETQYVIT